MKLYKNYIRYMQSSAWREKSTACIKRDKHCGVCTETKHLQAHHWKYPKRGKLGSEPIKWLIALCPRHHDAITNSDRFLKYAGQNIVIQDYVNITPMRSLDEGKGGENNASIKLENYRRVTPAFA